MLGTIKQPRCGLIYGTPYICVACPRGILSLFSMAGLTVVATSRNIILTHSCTKGRLVYLRVFLSAAPLQTITSLYLDFILSLLSNGRTS
jgi:hypothetical protein